MAELVFVVSDCNEISNFGKTSTVLIEHAKKKVLIAHFLGTSRIKFHVLVESFFSKLHTFSFILLLNLYFICNSKVVIRTVFLCLFQILVLCYLLSIIQFGMLD